jgi:hypothetical protein
MGCVRFLVLIVLGQVGGERERQRETKSLSSPIARPRGEEEEQCRLKQHYFVSFFF